MKQLRQQKEAWAIKWIDDSPFSRGGHNEHFIGNGDRSVWLFHSRQRARDAAKERYGYIAGRPDLKVEPHCWKMPRVVRVRVTVEELNR